MLYVWLLTTAAVYGVKKYDNLRKKREIQNEFVTGFDLTFYAQLPLQTLPM